MAHKLRKAIIGTAALYAGAGLAVGAGIVWLGAASPMLMAALPLGTGAFGAWRSMEKIKAGFIESVAEPFAYVRIERRRSHARKFDWSSIDDYAAQLAARGFTAVGDYTLHPMPRSLVAVASVFVDETRTVLLEIQHVKTLGVHFSLTSLVGGNVRVTTSDHVPTSSCYLIRGDSDVAGFYPGTGLFGLLELHDKMLSNIRSRTGKAVSVGLDIQRHLLLVRERLRRAHVRLGQTSGFAIATQVDRFEAEPAFRWAPSTDKLMAQPWRSLEALDATLDAREPAPVMDFRGPQTVL